MWGGKGPGTGVGASPSTHTGSRPGLQAGGRLKDGDPGAEASGAAVEGFLNVKAEVWDGRAGWRTLQTVSRSPGVEGPSRNTGTERESGGGGPEA